MSLVSWREFFEAAMATVFTTGRNAIEGALLTKEGRRIPYYFNGVRVAMEGGACTLGVGIDMTAQRLLEEQVRQSQRMESFGQMAGGVAHDFNNIVTVISGFSDFLLSKLSPSDPLREHVEQIRDRPDRGLRNPALMLFLHPPQDRDHRGGLAAFRIFGDLLLGPGEVIRREREVRGLQFFGSEAADGHCRSVSHCMRRAAFAFRALIRFCQKALAVPNTL